MMHQEKATEAGIGSMLGTVRDRVAHAVSNLLEAIRDASVEALQGVEKTLCGRVPAAGAAVIFAAGGLTGCATDVMVCGQSGEHNLDSIPVKIEPNLEWPSDHRISSVTLPNQRKYTIVENGENPSGMREDVIKNLVASVEYGLQRLSDDRLIRPGQNVGLFVEGRFDRYFRPECRPVRVAFTVRNPLKPEDIGPVPTKRFNLERGSEYRHKDYWADTLYSYAYKNYLTTTQVAAQVAASRQTPRRW